MSSEASDPGLSSALDRITTRITEAPASSEPRKLTAEERERAEGWRKWELLSQRIGERYAKCKLSEFVYADDAEVKTRQAEAIGKLERYQEDMPNLVNFGQGIVLFGPAGTGKDHCMAAMMRKACWHNLNVEWRNGMDLYADRRDAISREVPERDLIRDLVATDVLAISDPIPPWGNLTEGQAEFLFRVVDGRYRQRKPIWVTANFAEGKEAESRIGKQVVDRLRDGSLALFFDWPSFRKRAEA